MIFFVFRCRGWYELAEIPPNTNTACTIYTFWRHILPHEQYISKRATWSHFFTGPRIGASDEHVSPPNTGHQIGPKRSGVSVGKPFFSHVCLNEATACTSHVCPSRDLTSGGCFLFSPNICGSTYYVRLRAYMSRRRVPNHKPTWQLHTSASPPPLLLLSTESTTNLVGHNIFTSIRDRHKNIPGNLLKD